MKTLSEFPCFEVEFTKTGQPVSQDETNELLDFLSPNNVTDLLVISHGWNNDMEEARRLYINFFTQLRARLEAGNVPGAAGRTFAILAVLWPSKKFAEKELIPSGAAGATSAVRTEDVRQQLDELRGVFDLPSADAVLEKAKALLPKLEDSPTARGEFGDLLRSLLPSGRLTDDVDGAAEFARLDGKELVDRLSKPVPIAPPTAAPGQGGATRIGDVTSAAGPGSAAGIGNFFSGALSGARNLLNLTTYYQMKERAGVVGRDGLNPILRSVRAEMPDIRLHLIGHSFGGRLVSAAALGPDNQPPLRIDTLTLLQAAFSHYGFARDYEPSKNGFFRRVIDQQIVKGPVIVTCTSNDRAVGLAYPLASLMAGQVAAALGDKNSKYGGIGRNGAQKTPEADDGVLQGVSGHYDFAPGNIYNLNADACITGHSDICKKEVAHAVLTAIAAT